MILCLFILEFERLAEVFGIAEDKNNILKHIL